MDDFLDFDNDEEVENLSQNNANSTYIHELAKLNEKQKEAVNTLSGPVLVLAGAGTGKTKTIVMRIMNIIVHSHSNSNEILALTFTNKAANEMKNRISNAIGESYYPLTWIGTFHSICTRILRMHSKEIGLTSDFNIIDSGDQLSLVKKIMKDENICTKKHSPNLVLSLISKMKNDIKNESKKLEFDDEDDFIDLKKIYKIYEDRTIRANCVDFDDLIAFVIKIFKNKPEILEKYQNKFKFVIVDEYQDTNSAQYEFIKIISQKYKNLCCVGDEDQSIYGWRGADITNIFKLEQDFPNTKIIRLEENYRSNENIILCASNLIKNNNYRYDKTLFSKKKSNEKVSVCLFNNCYQEYSFLVKAIQNELQHTKASNMTILIRSSYQYKMLENAFISSGLKYHIVDGTKFYERMEIKDILSYLRLINSDHDVFSFDRVINVPKRGIGPKKIKSIVDYAYENDISVIDSLRNILEEEKSSVKLNKDNIEGINSFLDIIDSSRDIKKNSESLLSDLIKNIVEKTNYYDYLLEDDERDIADFRMNNIEELSRFIDTFENLQEFLEHIALISASDDKNRENSIGIMTMHSAKGLEYDTVFLPFWDEGTFPSLKSVENDTIEEERRLAYVSITRAKKKVFISSSRNRKIFGKINSSIESRFIDEMKYEFFDLNDYRNDEDLGFKNKNKFYDEEYPENYGLRVGIWVFHYKFGMSKVLKVIGNFVEIQSKDDNTKRIIHKDDLKI